jgi:hypothetical protein
MPDEQRPRERSPPEYFPVICGHFRAQRRVGQNWEVQFKNNNGVTIELGYGFDAETADRIKRQLSDVLRQHCPPRPPPPNSVTPYGDNKDPL